MLRQKNEAEKSRTILKEKVDNLNEPQTSQEVIDFASFLSGNLGSREIRQGCNQQTTEDIICFLKHFYNSSKPKNITTRALSILLYNDSKRLENLLFLCAPFFSRLQKALPSIHLEMPERSYPETTISGKLIFNFRNSGAPMINEAGIILNLPLESAELIESIKPINKKSGMKVLTIENKETFFALGGTQKFTSTARHLKSTDTGQSDIYENFMEYDCFLYTGGYPNRAAVRLIKILSASGFAFCHAGDLDPDGILILQNISSIAEKSVTPVKMDAAAFDKYRPWARSLDKSKLQQIKRIKEEIKAISEISGLLQRIEATGLGIEQEIIDYR